MSSTYTSDYYYVDTADMPRCHQISCKRAFLLMELLALP